MISVQRNGAVPAVVPGTPPTAGANASAVDPILATITARFVDGPHYGFSEGVGAGLAPFARRLAALGATDVGASPVTSVVARTDAQSSGPATTLTAAQAAASDAGRLLEDMANWLHSPPPGIGGRERALSRGIDPKPAPVARSVTESPVVRRDAAPVPQHLDIAALEAPGAMTAAIAAWMAESPAASPSAPPESGSTPADSAPAEHGHGRARARTMPTHDPVEVANPIPVLAAPLVDVPVLRAPAEWTPSDRPDATNVEAPVVAARAGVSASTTDAAESPAPRVAMAEADTANDPDASAPAPDFSRAPSRNTAPEPIRTRTPAMTTRPRGPAATGTPSAGSLMPGRSRDADLRRIISSLGDALRSAASVAQDPLARAAMPRPSTPVAPRASTSDPTAVKAGPVASDDPDDAAVPALAVPAPALQADVRPDVRHADPELQGNDASAVASPLVGEANGGGADAADSPLTPAASHGHARDAVTGSGETTPAPVVQAQPGHAEAVATPRIVERTVGEDLRSAHWAKAVASHLVELSHDQIDTATLRLSPEHLGPIEVHIHLQDNVVNLNFGATHADTRSTLEQAMPTLREAFAGAGLSLGQATVQQEMRQGSQDRQVIPQGPVGAADELSVNSEVRRALSLVDEYA